MAWLLAIPHWFALLFVELAAFCVIFVAWFAVLITLLERFHDHPIGAWLRRSTVYAGVLLILFGAYFTFRTFFAFEA